MAQDVNITRIELYDDKKLPIKCQYAIDPNTYSPLIFDENRANPVTACDLVFNDYLHHSVNQLENESTEKPFEYTITDTRYALCKDAGFVKVTRIVVIHETNKI